LNLYANNIGTIPCNFSGTTSYGYDDLYQLTSADHPETTTLTDETYNYDQVGNRISDSSVTGAISYNPNNELTGHSTVTYEYDNNGNTTKKTEGTGSQGVPVPLVTTYHYNAKNRLSQVDLPDGRTATYSYDPFGRRISKTVGTGSGTVPVPITTYYLYSDEGLIGEYSSSGSWQKSYGWRPNGMWGTNPLYQRNSTGIYYYHNDHLGTPQRLTSATTGEIVWSANYAAFGKADIDPLSTVENNLRFPGQYYDQETNLHYNWHRTYDPGTGRYMQIDPIGFAGGDVNLYRYVEDNPVNIYDSEGLMGRRPTDVPIITKRPGTPNPIGSLFWPPNEKPCRPFDYCDKEYEKKKNACKYSPNAWCLEQAREWIQQCYAWAANQ